MTPVRGTPGRSVPVVAHRDVVLDNLVVHVALRGVVLLLLLLLPLLLLLRLRRVHVERLRNATQRSRCRCSRLGSLTLARASSAPGGTPSTSASDVSPSLHSVLTR